jgi:hypothetical protein
MKKAIIITCVFIFSISFLYAQKTESIKVSGTEYTDFIAKNEYKYPAYSKAEIAFKNGVVARARINYDNFKNVMKYLGDKGDTLEIANPEDINYIAIGPDSIFYDKGYFQWVASSATARLVARHTFKEGPRALVGAFGTASPAKHVESRTAFLNNDGISTKQLAKNEEVTFIKETTYYISPINKTEHNFVLATKKNIDKLFPKRKVEDFIKENRINLNKEQDLIDLMVHISKPKN